jgi:hypothetical protein
MKDAELRHAIAELQNALADAKTSVADLKTENLKLRQSLEDAMTSASVEEELVQRGDAYFRKDPPEGKPKGPFCINCFDGDKKLVKLTAMAPHFHVIATHRCPQCENKVSL